MKEEQNFGYDFEVIDNIRNNLESYKIQNNNGFPILKELIQNANDAQATKLILKYFQATKTPIMNFYEIKAFLAFMIFR